jgi:hypothetical protein
LVRKKCVKLGIPWVFSNAMIQRTVPKEVIGRVLVLDYGLLMNVSQLMTIVTIGFLLDVVGLNVFQLALVGSVFGGCLSIYYGIWCFLTRNYE